MQIYSLYRDWLGVKVIYGRWNLVQRKVPISRTEQYANDISSTNKKIDKPTTSSTPEKYNTIKQNGDSINRWYFKGYLTPQLKLLEASAGVAAAFHLFQHPVHVFCRMSGYFDFWKLPRKRKICKKNTCATLTSCRSNNGVEMVCKFLLVFRWRFL